VLQFDANTVIYAGTDRGASTAASVAVNDDEGAVIATRTIIHDETAPEAYRMAISLAAGETLQAVDEQRISILDAAGATVSRIVATSRVRA
jgi:hypothetical protein